MLSQCQLNGTTVLLGVRDLEFVLAIILDYKVVALSACTLLAVRLFPGAVLSNDAARGEHDGTGLGLAKRRVAQRELDLLGLGVRLAVDGQRDPLSVAVLDRFETPRVALAKVHNGIRRKEVKGAGIERQKQKARKDEKMGRSLHDPIPLRHPLGLGHADRRGSDQVDYIARGRHEALLDIQAERLGLQLQRAPGRGQVVLLVRVDQVHVAVAARDQDMLLVLVGNEPVARLGGRRLQLLGHISKHGLAFVDDVVLSGRDYRAEDTGVRLGLGVVLEP